MKLHSVVMTLTAVWMPAALAQDKAPPEPPVPVVEVSVQQPSEEQQEEERLLIQKLEQIENDPVVRARAEAEAEVPLNAF